MEFWKPTHPKHGDYEVSTLGRVRKGRHILRQYGVPHRPGERLVKLRVGSKTVHVMVHRLVMSAFVQYVGRRQFVRHIDGNPENNHLENLRCVKRGLPKHDARREQWYSYGQNNGNGRIPDTVVQSLLDQRAYGSRLQDLATSVGASVSWVSCVIRGKIRTNVIVSKKFQTQAITLRSQGLTYKDIAYSMNVGEPVIRRCFNAKHNADEKD